MDGAEHQKTITRSVKRRKAILCLSMLLCLFVMLCLSMLLCLTVMLCLCLSMLLCLTVMLCLCLSMHLIEGNAFTLVCHYQTLSDLSLSGLISPSLLATLYLYNHLLFISVYFFQHSVLSRTKNDTYVVFTCNVFVRA